MAACLLSLPRELIALIAAKPAATRALHRVCRILSELTRGLFKFKNTRGAINGTEMYTLLADERLYTIMYSAADSAVMDYYGGQYYGGRSEYSPQMSESFFNSEITVDNMIFVIIRDKVAVSAAQYTDTIAQFIGIPVDRIYRVTGYYNNFAGTDYDNCVCNGGKYTLAAKLTQRSWTINTTNTPLHQLRGCIL